MQEKTLAIFYIVTIVAQPAQGLALEYFFDRFRGMRSQNHQPSIRFDGLDLVNQRKLGDQRRKHIDNHQRPMIRIALIGMQRH